MDAFAEVQGLIRIRRVNRKEGALVRKDSGIAISPLHVSRDRILCSTWKINIDFVDV